MNYTQLVEGLKSEEAKKIESIRISAEREMQKRRKIFEEDILGFENNLRESFESKKAELKSDLMSSALKKKREIFLRNEEELKGRIFQLIEKSIGKSIEINPAERMSVFIKLAEELPEEQWEKVYISPEDSEYAKERFPGVSIIIDESIAAGLRVSCWNGAFEVDNTLKKRVERAYERTLPLILKQIYEEIGELRVS